VPSLLSFSAALRVDAGIWALWSMAVGWWVSRRPDAVMGHDGWITRLRPWEREGRAYARLGIRRWKGHLPDLGTLFGGRPKQLAGHRDPGDWQTLAAETRRAERAHWLILLALPLEAVIRSGVVLVPMAAYAVIANGPCIAAQRHNRGRLGALLEARQRRARQSSSCRTRQAT
jgi:glycosyl-4,4'-diaponeurosporenoate acyltransferase